MGPPSHLPVCRRSLIPVVIVKINLERVAICAFVVVVFIDDTILCKSACRAHYRSNGGLSLAYCMPAAFCLAEVVCDSYQMAFVSLYSHCSDLSCLSRNRVMTAVLSAVAHSRTNIFFSIPNTTQLVMLLAAVAISPTLV